MRYVLTLFLLRELTSVPHQSSLMRDFKNKEPNMFMLDHDRNSKMDIVLNIVITVLIIAVLWFR